MAGGAQRLPGPWARQSTSIALGKTQCEPYACKRPMCVRVCALSGIVFFVCFFLVNSYPLPETLRLQMKAVNFLLYVSVFKKL